MTARRSGRSAATVVDSQLSEQQSVAHGWERAVLAEGREAAAPCSSAKTWGWKLPTEGQRAAGDEQRKQHRPFLRLALLLELEGMWKGEGMEMRKHAFSFH